ncbi:MAG TPA: NADP-dependent malic enzyme [Nitrososphaeraceae archaeon]|nr:NADP-dependent malic enzyme [Nitrososphaeraceae archaeon]
MNIKDDSINLHRMLKGKIEIQNRVPIENIFAKENSLINLIYTPGVAYVASEIGENKDLAYDFTSKWNNVAIICDGTRVLGLGNIGPYAALPVMEGKSVLFKLLGGINAIPLCIETQNKEEIIQFVKYIQPFFGAINIEDIESPKVLEIVERLKKEITIPVFHDDQHGTAIITLSALINSLKIVRKQLEKSKIVILGAGSAGYGINKILNCAGCKNTLVVDSKGAIYEGRKDLINNQFKSEIASKSNPDNIEGSLDSVIEGSDVFIGVSGKGNILNKKVVSTMNFDPIVFALSNPYPEILPPSALDAGAKIVATGRSDFPNQVNNAVIFPSVIRALLDLRVKLLNENLMVNVAYAIANLVEIQHLKPDYIIPPINDQRILPVVTQTLKSVIQKTVTQNYEKETNIEGKI